MSIRRWVFPKGHRAAYHYNRGTVCYMAGSFLLAEAHLREAVGLWPRFPEALHNLGLALVAQDRIEEAIEAFEQALSQRPRFPEAINNYGIALAMVGRIQQAMDAFHEALRQKPDYLKARENLEQIARIVNRHIQ